MPFLVIGHLKPGADVNDKLQVLRLAQMQTVAQMAEDGSMRLGGALCDQDGHTQGNMAVLTTSDRSAAQDWVDTHPFMQAELWDRVEVFELKIAPVFEKAD